MHELGVTSVPAFTLATRVSVYEECCREGCDTEEMYENMYPGGFRVNSRVSTNIAIYRFCQGKFKRSSREIF